MTISIIAAGSVAAMPDGTLDLTLADTSGATLLVAAIAYPSSVGTPLDPNDSPGNDWLALDTLGGTPNIKLWVCINPLTTQSHQFVSQSDQTAAMSVVAFGGLETSNPQVESETSGFGLSAAISFSTIDTNQLVVCAFALGHTRDQSVSADAPTAIATQQPSASSTNNCVGIGYQFQASTGAVSIGLSWPRVDDNAQIAVAFDTAGANSSIRRESPPFCGLILHI